MTDIVQRNLKIHSLMDQHNQKTAEYHTAITAFERSEIQSKANDLSALLNVARSQGNLNSTTYVDLHGFDKNGSKITRLGISDDYGCISEYQTTDLDWIKGVTGKAKKQYQYSEIFGDTFQGEGRYTGVPTVWIRFWGCNFECGGFSQPDPTDKSTWNLDYQTVDVSSIKRMEDLPVFDTGCDSSYSWSKKFAHLAHKSDVVSICDKLEEFLKKGGHNPEGKFKHPKSGQWTHLAFTGGEPMMNQNAIVDIMLEFARRGNVPKYVTVETNGTQVARDKFSEYLSGEFDGTYEEMLKSFYMRQLRNLKAENFSGLSQEEDDLVGTEWFWSVSPKLYLSGEQKKDALQPEVVAKYAQLSNHGQLKYVCDGSDRAWQEVEEFTATFREAGIQWPVWIMPVGATAEGQNKIQATVAEEAVRRGYNVAARVHCFVFNNIIGK
jgi:7-carboxy-7-deazaguanine synthase